jgi:hypothetical protein
MQRRYDGRFFGRRVNCERVPALPAWAVRQVLNDPRKIPYLLLCTSARAGEIKEAVRVGTLGPTPYLTQADSIEVKRANGSVVNLRVFRRSLPKRTGTYCLLARPSCCALKCCLYGWAAAGECTDSARVSTWKCRACAGLRYASEGGARVIRMRGAAFARFTGLMSSPRPDMWYPFLFDSPAYAVATGFLGNSTTK